MLSLSQQKRKFLSVKAKNSIKAGSPAFLVAAWWFNRWKSAVGMDSPTDSSDSKKNSNDIKIPPINNSILLIKDRIKPTLTEKYDFVILSPPLWKLLYEWYPGEGPEIQVEMIEHPVEHIPVPILSELTFSVFYTDQSDPEKMLKSIDIKVNKYQKIQDIKEKVCEELKVDPSTAIIRDFWNHNNLPPLPDDAYIYSQHLVDTQELLLQVKDATSPLRRPRNRMISRTNSSMTIINAPYLHLNITTKGHVGLTNLGNTCFFNSAVQALSHTQMLAAFFLNAKWRQDINSSNRLSTNGLLTNSFAQVVNDLWTKELPYLSPERLFHTIAEYAPRFGDHNQHDAQELMMFLLDGLHEDLNRANKNVYVEGFEGDSQSEEVAAEAGWKRHKLTNDSIIVDLFHGQLESQLECPVCHCKKIVFDPYLCVTLPLPDERMRSVKYFYVPFDMKAMRHFIKTRVIYTTEEENIKEDANKRFNILSEGDQFKDILVVERDSLMSIFGVKLPPILRRAEYFVFEIPDKRKLYSIASVYCEFVKKSPSAGSNVSTIIDGPILVEVPEIVLKSQSEINDVVSQSKSSQGKQKAKSDKTKKKTIKKAKAKIVEQKRTKNKNSTSLIQTRSSTKATSRSSPPPSSRRKKEATPQIPTRMQTRASKNKQKSEDDEYEKIEEEEEENSEETVEDPSEMNDEEIEEQLKSSFLFIFKEIQKIADERLSAYWEDSEYKVIDPHRKQDLNVSPNISDWLLDRFAGDTSIRMFAEPININDYENIHIAKIISDFKYKNDNFFFFERSPDFNCLSLSSMKIVLNPLLSKMDAGFKWQAVMPLARDDGIKADTTINLLKCFEYFSYPDKLDELNEWFCPTCRKLARAFAKLDIWSVPDNLILHLKRFVYKDDGSYKKLTGKIYFPEIIDMQPFVRGPQRFENNLKYKIYSVINHIGAMNGGHYTASAFSETEDKWYVYNDENVYPTKEKITNSDLPYVLFYRRIDSQNPV